MKVKNWEDLTQKEKITRWAHAVRVIENLDAHEIKNHFNMGTWGEKTECGTIGCAAGLCGLDPALRRQGFKLNFLNNVMGNFADFSISPQKFFGYSAYIGIFINEKFIYSKGNRVHSKVLKEMKKYLKELKDSYAT